MVLLYNYHIYILYMLF